MTTNTEASLTLREAAAAVGGELRGPDATFAGVGTDTRTLRPGNLFVALVGARFDAHAFVGEASAQGAAALLVSQPVAEDLPQIVVADTRLALGRLASAWRARLSLKVVAVTGSNGKTTVKEMTAAILRCAGPVHATQGNLNNDIGVPLTLLKLNEGHRYAVIEMGANHPGEIAYLTELARPDVALITNASSAHLAGFGDVAGVARAKGEIYQGLTARGVAVINADDVYADYWRRLNSGRRCVQFGLEHPAEVGATWQGDARGSALRISAEGVLIEVNLPLPGRHNVLNALAATAAALALGATPAQVRQGLESLAGVPGRLQGKAGAAGAWVIDDTYNANPGSVAAALAVLAASPGEKYLVLGDMGELGAQGEALHAQAGAQARAAGVTRLYAIGELSGNAVAAFGVNAWHFATVEELIAALRQALHAGVTVLVKGSRFMRMERVVQALTVDVKE